MQFTAGQKVRTLFDNQHNMAQKLLLGKDETKVEKLRSIMAQLEYKHQTNILSSKGVPFKDHLYVPEVHPITGVEFCEWEDDGHVFKVFPLQMLC